MTAVATAANARDQVRPLGRLRVELALDACGLEVLAQQLRRSRFVAWRVRRIDADQPLEKLRDLAQRRVPVVSR